MPDVERLRRALQIAGAIVERDGPTYLPVFLLLEAELERVDETQSAMERARAAARRAA